MTDRTLKLLEGGRAVPRGFEKNAAGAWVARQDEDEVLDYILDYSGKLGSDTISTSTFSVDGVTKDSDANTTTTATVWLSSPNDGAEVINTVVTASGRTYETTFFIANITSYSGTDYQ